MQLANYLATRILAEKKNNCKSGVTHLSDYGDCGFRILVNTSYIKI